MINNIQIPQCPHCQADLVEKQGKKGKYYTCPNWSKDGTGCEGTIWFPPRKGGLKQREPLKEVDQGEKILEAIRIVNENVKSLISFVENKLGSK